jgi:hypothetical protein
MGCFACLGEKSAQQRLRLDAREFLRVQRAKGREERGNRRRGFRWNDASELPRWVAHRLGRIAFPVSFREELCRVVVHGQTQSENAPAVDASPEVEWLEKRAFRDIPDAASAPGRACWGETR